MLGPCAIALVVAILGEVCQAKLGSLFLVVCPHQALAVAVVAETPTGLHAHTRLDLGDHVRAHGIVAASPRDHLETIWIAARQVQEVDPREGDEEAAEEGECVDGVGGVETAVEYERGTEGCGREGDVVEGVDAARVISSLDTVNVQYIGKETYMLVGNWLNALLK